MIEYSSILMQVLFLFWVAGSITEQYAYVRARILIFRRASKGQLTDQKGVEADV
jgi:hypothetical protein